MRHTRTLAIALAGLLAVGAAACGSDDDDGSDDATTTTEAVEDETTTTTEAEPDGTTTTVTDEGNTAIEQLAQATLITLEDLNVPGLQDLGYTPSPGPNQCGFDIDATYPPEVIVGADYGSNTLRFLEEIRVYATPDDAATAFQAGVDGTQCEVEDGTVISAPVDVTEQVGAQRAMAITATRGEDNVIVVAALISDAVMSFNFAGTDEAAAGAPPPVEVAALGVGKLKAVLESAGN